MYIAHVLSVWFELTEVCEYKYLRVQIQLWRRTIHLHMYMYGKDLYFSRYHCGAVRSCSSFADLVIKN